MSRLDSFYCFPLKYEVQNFIGESQRMRGSDGWRPDGIQPFDMVEFIDEQIGLLRVERRRWELAHEEQASEEPQLNPGPLLEKVDALAESVQALCSKLDEDQERNRNLRIIEGGK